MRKEIFTLVALFVCMLSASAQIKFGTKDFASIPSEFTIDHKPYLWTSESGLKDASVISIYDYDLNLVEKFNLGENAYIIESNSHVDTRGMSYDDGKIKMPLTQTLFNDDAEWEYLVPVMDGKYVQYYLVKNTKGKVVGKIDMDEDIDINVFGDKIYFSIREAADVNTWYFVPASEVRNFVQAATGVQSVDEDADADDEDAAQYDLSGKKVNDSYKGIVVSGNTKVLK